MLPGPSRCPSPPNDLFVRLPVLWDPNNQSDDRTKIVTTILQSQKKKAPFAERDDLDKAFLKGAKQFTALAVGAINGLNLFGTTRAYNAKGKEMINTRPEGAFMKVAFMTSTGLGVVFTLAVAAFSQSTKFHPSWLNSLSICILFEMLYLSASSAMFGFYLDESDSWVLPLMASTFVFAFMAFAMSKMFKRPNYKRSNSGADMEGEEATAMGRIVAVVRRS